MKICFCATHPYWGGLSNNGGSKTIILSAKTLSDMGHQVDIAATSDKFTWFDHKKTLKHIPKGYDSYIACSIADIEPMIAVTPKGKRFWWMRGIEKWIMPKDDIRKIAKNTKIIVIAKHLKDWLGKQKIESRLCYAGHDIDFFTPNPRHIGDHIVGTLKHHKHKTKGYKLAKEMIAESGAKRNILKSTDNKNQQEMKDYYNSCNIWLSATTLEGYHQAAAEACLCGCLLIALNSPHNGMSDYATNSTAMLFSNKEEGVEYIKNPDYSRIPAMIEHIKSNIGDRKTNMKKFLEIIS